MDNKTYDLKSWPFRQAMLPFSLNELASLLKSFRLGWGPPLELTTRMLNPKIWVMDMWAMLPFSLNELVSLLKSFRLGCDPPLELATRVLNSKLWVMETDVWADLLIVCCWANPTTIYCEDCGNDVEATTTSCNHVVCLACIARQGSSPRRCPKCGQQVVALFFVDSLASGRESASKLLICVCFVLY